MAWKHMASALASIDRLPGVVRPARLLLKSVCGESGKWQLCVNTVLRPVTGKQFDACSPSETGPFNVFVSSSGATSAVAERRQAKGSSIAAGNGSKARREPDSSFEPSPHGAVMET
jgi:hypothetical protein